MEMAGAIYWLRGSTQAPTTPEKCTRMRRILKEKLSRSWKRWLVLQPPQKSNARQEARKRFRQRKRNLTKHPITLRKNYSPTLIRKEKKNKRAVKLYRSAKKRKQRRQRCETKIHSARMMKIRALQWVEMPSGVIKTKTTISKTQLCRKRTNIMIL